MAVTYTPSKNDAAFTEFAGVPFDDPISYGTQNNRRIDARFHLKPIQDEVLNLIAIAAAGGGAFAVRNESGSSLSAGPVKITGYSAVHARFLVTRANAVSNRPAHAVLLAALADNENATAYLGGDVAFDTTGSGRATRSTWTRARAGSRSRRRRARTSWRRSSGA